MSALNSTAVKSPTEGMIWSSLRETVPKDKRTEDCARILLNSAARADNEIPQLNRQIEILGFLEVFFGGSSLASSIVTFTGKRQFNPSS